MRTARLLPITGLLGCASLAGALHACAPAGDPVTEVPGLPEAIPAPQIELTDAGPSPERVTAFSNTLLTHPAVVARAGGHRVGLLRMELLPPEDAPPSLPFLPTTRFIAVVYDYDADAAFQITGDLDRPDALVLADSPEVLPPTLDEVEEALRILRAADPTLAADLDAGRRETFRAMPPTQPHPEGHRVISLGVRPTDDETTGEIVGIDLSAGVVVHHEGGSPPDARVGGFVCNPPPTAAQPGSGRGVNGWAQVRIVQNGVEVWSMYVRRPSASGGSQGSGVELFDVRYLGKRVLKRAHVPILNVQYTNNTCGPYRDWQWAENPFEVGRVQRTVGNGIALVDWAKTMRETRNDTGNFQGVAMSWDPIHGEAVLVSELEAGWYRYVSEWRFGMDGTLEPRWGFDAVQNWCTCQEHTHHAYWRLDFDINGPANRVAELNNGVWAPLATEAERTRDDANGRAWRVERALTGESWRIDPRPGEDAADAYGIADLWVLAADANEITDDAAPPAGIPTQAGLSGYVDGESVLDTDLVVWWAGHFLHNDANPTANQTHTVGLVLTPENW